MKIAVVIPVFNHARTIEQVIHDVRAVCATIMDADRLIVVDDGCTDGSTEILQRQSAITLLTHPQNRGKGNALLTAFHFARDQGFTHAVTIDADGQHCPADILPIVAAARTHPDDLIIGYRDMATAGANVPARSKRGRDAATFWLRVQTGQHIPDSQCGLRIYPLEHVLSARYRFRRFDFETEVLARMAWGGLQIHSVPVTCIYFPAAKRVSHFRPVIDTLRGVRVNIFLVMRRLFPLPFRRLCARDEESVKFGKWWRLSAWKRAVRNALRAGSTNAELATAFALGIFLGLTPLYGLQTILAIYFSRRLHLNVLSAVIGSQISIPPLLPLWLLLSYGTGNFLLHGRWIAANLGGFSRRMIPTLLLGNLLVALCAAVAGLLIARCVLSVVRNERLAG